MRETKYLLPAPPPHQLNPHDPLIRYDLLVFLVSHVYCLVLLGVICWWVFQENPLLRYIGDGQLIPITLQ